MSRPEVRTRPVVAIAVDYIRSILEASRPEVRTYHQVNRKSKPRSGQTGSEKSRVASRPEAPSSRAVPRSRSRGQRTAARGRWRPSRARSADSVTSASGGRHLCTSPTRRTCQTTADLETTVKRDARSRFRGE